MPTIKKQGSKNRPIGDKDLKNYLECGMLNFEYTKPFAIHIHGKSGKVDWIWY